MRTEIAVLFLKRMMDNTLESARKVENQIAGFVNKTIKDPIRRVEEPNFTGLMIGPPKGGPVVLYFHGGGYTICSATTYIASLSRLLQISNVQRKMDLQILSLEYTLAPEARFPGQLNEALASLTYLSKLDVPIFLMGDSAGGNLVLALLQKIQNTPLAPRIKGAILVSPWVNTEMPPKSAIKNMESDFVDVPQLERHLEHFLPTKESNQNPLISPVRCENMEGFPPMLVHYGGVEIFEEDIEDLISKAKQFTDVKVFREDFGPHITPMMIPFFPEMAERGLQVIAEFIGSKS
jgi:acetyl esterase/lipase